MPVLTDLQDAIAGLKARLVKHHGINGLEVAVRPAGQETFVVSGRVLLFATLQTLKELLAPFGAQVSYQVCLPAISSTRYITPAGERLNVFAAPGSRRLHMQLLAHDPPCQVVSRHGDYLFVRSKCRVHGWVVARECVACPPGRKYMVLQPGQQILLTRDKTQQVVAYLSRFVDRVRYRWGASSYREMDCSGLVMRCFLDQFNICIPKHSWDQKQLFRHEVPLADCRPLDLLFCRQRETHNKHVAMIIRTHPSEVIEASLTKKRVVVTPLDAFRQSFAVQAAKRPFLPMPATCNQQ